MASTQTLLVRIPGGIGKNIAFTAVLPKLAEKYAGYSIYIATGWEDVYWNNPHITRAFNFQHEPIYANELLDAEIIHLEPYFSRRFYKKQSHIIEEFCKFLDLEYDENMKPNLYPSRDVEWDALSLIEEAEKRTGKEVLLLQYAGADPANQGQRRSMPFYIVNKFVEKISDRYCVINIGTKEIKSPDKAFSIQAPLKTVLCMPKFRKFMGVDSFLQHAAAAFEESCGAVFWAGTHWNNFGYSKFHNFHVRDLCPQPFCNRPRLAIPDIKFYCRYGNMCLNLTVARLEKMLEKVEKMETREIKIPKQEIQNQQETPT